MQRPPRTAAVPAAAAAARAPSPPELVELRAGAGIFCVRSQDGRLWCWGLVPYPGNEEPAWLSRPTLMEGLPPLSGFTIAAYRSIVGWDRDGNPVLIARDPFGRGDATIAVHHDLPIARSIPPRSAGAPESPTIVDAAGDCLLTKEGELLCAPNALAHLGQARFVRLPFAIRRLGDGPCAIDASGLPVAYHVFKGFEPTLGRDGPKVRAFEPVPVETIGQVEALACLLDDTAIDVCATDEGGEVRCTDRDVEASLNAKREGQPAVDLRAIGKTVCLRRADGQARCASREARMEALLPSLVGLQAQRGLAGTHSVMCVLGRNGPPRCWGEAGSPELGDDSRFELEGPRHLPAYDGADAISSGGGVTCVRMAPLELRCFGRVGTARVDPTPIPLPEPVDALVGGFPFCVRGASRKSWFCRDPYGSFFSGTLPGGFEPVRDPRGDRLGSRVQSIATGSGTGIVAVLDDGSQRAFLFRARRRPLRFRKSSWFGAPVARIETLEAAIMADGSGFMTVGDLRRELPAPVQQVSPPCYLGASGELWCYPSHASNARIIASGIRALSTPLTALSEQGEVLVPRDRDEPARGFRRVAGLPAMETVAGFCGLSREHQVWCWGDKRNLDGLADRLTPRPVSL